jgi:hypothetical protein
MEGRRNNKEQDEKDTKDKKDYKNLRYLSWNVIFKMIIIQKTKWRIV